jgi:apolipoprotein N-acyltransferase
VVAQFETAHTGWVTRTENRQVIVNLLIRFALVGFLTWWIAARAGSGPAWGTAIYAVVDLLMFGLAVLLLAGLVLEHRRRPERLNRL